MSRIDRFARMQWLAIGIVCGGGAIVAWIDVTLGGILLVAGMLAIIVASRRGTSPPPSTPRRLVTDGGEQDIEMVTAVIRPGRLNEVKQALATAGAPSLTVTNVSGRGTQPTETGQWRGEEYIVDLHQKVKVEVVVTDDKTEDVVGAIQDAAHTGEPGDGKIWVLPIIDALRVSTEERGPAAI